MIQKYYALANQNIYDVCLMTYGSLDQLFKLIADNSFGTINNYPVQGQSFIWDDTFVLNQQSSITNSLNKINYATRASDTGNIIFNIQSNGLPIHPTGIVTPTPAIGATGTGKYDYYVVYNSDPRYNVATKVFTDPYLKGRAGYAVYAQQLSQFFSVTEGVDLHYDSVAGTFTILTTGFSLIDSYYLVVYPNKYDALIP